MGLSAPAAPSLIDTGLSTGVKPAPVLGRSFLASDTDQLFTNDGVTWSPVLKHVQVASLADFPAPVAGVITLADNHAYHVNGTVDIGTNRIVVGVKNTIVGTDRQNDILTSSTPDVMFTMDNSSVPKATLIFDNLTLKATAGTLISAFGGATPNQVTFITTTITATPNGGTFSNVAFSMRTSSLSGFTTNGFVFSGTNQALTFHDSSATNNVGTVFDLTGGTLSVVRIGRNSITASSGNTFLNATGATITAAAQVALNIFQGTSTPFVGVSEASASWVFTANQGIANTAIDGSDYATSNADSVALEAGFVAAAAQTPGIVRAKATDMTRPGIGIVTAASTAGSSATVRTDGTLTLADWTAPLGTTSLTPRQVYYVDPSADGKITATVPTATGHSLQIIGVGVTSDTLGIQIGQPVLL